MKTLVVYNTCGIGRDNSAAYQRPLANLSRQESICLAVSGCMMSPSAKESLLKITSNAVWIDEPLPLNVTFNLSVNDLRRYLGDFDCYVYCASDVDVGQHVDTIRRLTSHLTGDVACVAAVVDRDGGYDRMKIDVPHENGSPTVLPLGKTVNMHLQAWSKDYLEKYGRLLPDVFASDCSEQVMPYLCSAIGKRFALSPVRVSHARNSDGASSGFPRGSGRHCQLFRSTRTLEQLLAEGAKVGWGFEEWLDVLHHDPSFYDDGLSKSNTLHEWLNANLFVNCLFSYEKVKRSVVVDHKSATDPEPKDWSFVFPTRSRPKMLEELLESISRTTKRLDRIEALVVVDDDDEPTLSQVERLGRTYGFVKWVLGPRQHNFSIHYYNNPALVRSKGRYVQALNDDCLFVTKDWDVKALQSLDSAPWPEVYGKCDDGLGCSYACFPVLSRALLETLGWMFHPEFTAWGADIHLYQVCSAVGRCIDLPFSINHLKSHDESHKRLSRISRYNYGSVEGEASRLRNALKTGKSVA